MRFDKANNVNLHVDESQAFQKKLKQVDTTYTNRMISRVRINVPDVEDYRVGQFDVGEGDLETPLTCRIEANNSYMLRRMRPIKTPEFKPYEYKMRPFNDYLPFVENQPERPHGEIYFRKQTLTPLNEMPKIDTDLDDKINMKKW